MKFRHPLDKFRGASFQRLLLWAMRNPDHATLLKAGNTPPHRGFHQGYGASQGAFEAWLLKNLNTNPPGREPPWIHTNINERAALHKRIQECKTPEGKVWIEESGRDCDCVSYSGKLSQIDATVAAFVIHERHVSHWADGPFSLAIVPESEAKQMTYRSRDNVMEAFEDGHPHSVVIRSPE